MNMINNGLDITKKPGCEANIANNMIFRWMQRT